MPVFSGQPDRQQQGKPIKASMLRDTSDQLGRVARDQRHVDLRNPPVTPAASGSSIFYAKITGCDGTFGVVDKHSWVEVVPNSSRSWIEKSGGRTGTLSTDSGYLLFGNDLPTLWQRWGNLALGSIVLIHEYVNSDGGTLYVVHHDRPEAYSSVFTGSIALSSAVCLHPDNAGTVTSSDAYIPSRLVSYTNDTTGNKGLFITHAGRYRLDYSMEFSAVAAWNATMYYTLETWVAFSPGLSYGNIGTQYQTAAVSGAAGRQRMTDSCVFTLGPADVDPEDSRYAILRFWADGLSCTLEKGNWTLTRMSRASGLM